MRWPRRYIALIAVLAVHFVLVAVLSVGSRGRLPLTARNDISTTIVSLPTMPAKSLTPVPDLRLAPLTPVTPFMPEAPSISMQALDSPPEPIDWQAEAHRAATTITNSNPPPPPTEDRRKTASAHGPRPWVPKSTHHAGEQYKTITGDTVVWVSDKCFVKSSAPLPTVPGFIARQLLTSTVCPGSGHEARGDLFEALPAYKKLHPEAAGAADPSP